MDYRKEKQDANCPQCEFYDYDEDYECYFCRMNLDEDETVRFMSGRNASCPYFRFYDEYKSVQRQI